MKCSDWGPFTTQPNTSTMRGRRHAGAVTHRQVESIGILCQKNRIAAIYITKVSFYPSCRPDFYANPCWGLQSCLSRKRTWLTVRTAALVQALIDRPKCPYPHTRHCSRRYRDVQCHFCGYATPLHRGSIQPAVHWPGRLHRTCGRCVDRLNPHSCGGTTRRQFLIIGSNLAK